MRHPALTLGILLITGLCHVAFFFWLLEGVVRDSPGALRAAAAALCGGLLLWSGVRSQTPSSMRLVSKSAIAMGIASCTVASIAWFKAPPLYALSLLLFGMCAGYTYRGRGVFEHKSALGLLVLAYPFEQIADKADHLLQAATAAAASLLLKATGLPMQLHQLPSPRLTHETLIVHVTALCAGTPPLLALTTLTLVLAEAFIENPAAKRLFILSTPPIGFFGNIVRVAISTHAANFFSDHYWTIAHDAIGYATFLGIYVFLFCTVLRMRRSAANPNVAKMHNDDSTTIQGPKRT